MTFFNDENLMISIPLLIVILLILVILIVFGAIYGCRMLRNRDDQTDSGQVWKAAEDNQQLMMVNTLSFGGAIAGVEHVEEV